MWGEGNQCETQGSSNNIYIFVPFEILSVVYKKIFKYSRKFSLLLSHAANTKCVHTEHMKCILYVFWNWDYTE